MVVELCGNCRYANQWVTKRPCAECFPATGNSKWEAKEDEPEKVVHKEDVQEL